MAGKRHTEGEIDVSVVVPVFNNLVYTLTSLVSLLEHDSRRSYEILIGDDGSTDATPRVFAATGGCIRLIRHEQNLGFLGNCNRTASFTKGRNIAFLNNDTLLLPGWLDALVDALEKTPDAGLAGSKLLNADGTLQEAGGILWRDGSAWNFGRNDDPGSPAYNYLKDVDYVSGASLALPATLWRQLGGFDVEFAPAYCEDSTSPSACARLGCEPSTRPFHADPPRRSKPWARHGHWNQALQVENQKKLFSRWKHVLEDDRTPTARACLWRATFEPREPHILFVDHYIPQWDRDAGSRTMSHFLRIVRCGRLSGQPVARQFARGQGVLRAAPVHGHRSDLRTLPGRRLREIHRRGRSTVLDYALVSRPDVAIKYSTRSGPIPRAQHPVSMGTTCTEADGAARALASAAAKPDAPQDEDSMRKLEGENWRKADVVLYPSIEERDLVRSLVSTVTAAQVPMLGYLPDELAIARNNLARFDQRSADELLSSAARIRPNVDALLWFARKVMPRVLAGNPRARLNIVGATMAAAVERLDSGHDPRSRPGQRRRLASLYASMGVALVPLRYGAGVKGICAGS